MQAFWSGLFGDKYGTEADRAGYKRFNRYWKDDMSMYQLETKQRHGTWFYIKRFCTEKFNIQIIFWFSDILRRINNSSRIHSIEIVRFYLDIILF